jgi:hypothetical protein
MATKTYNTILLKSAGKTPQEELVAFAALLPGHIVERKADGTTRKNSTAGAPIVSVAVEDDLQGRTIDTAYSAGDTVFIRDLQKGDWAYVFVAPGVSYAVGDKLTPNGSGELRKSVAATQAGTTPFAVSVFPDVPVFEVIDPAGIDLSAGGAVATRVAVRVL